MASLKCNRCGFGIHYHDDANGVEYVAYSQDMWDGLSETDAPIVSYTDENKDFLFVWQCAKCGCIHAMNGSTWRVTRAYVPTNEEIALESARKYLVFIDYLRDKVFDEEWTAAQFMQSGEYPNDQFFYAMVGDDGVIVYEDADCSTPLRRYKAIATVMKG